MTFQTRNALPLNQTGASDESRAINFPAASRKLTDMDERSIVICKVSVLRMTESFFCSTAVLGDFGKTLGRTANEWSAGNVPSGVYKSRITVGVRAKICSPAVPAASSRPLGKAFTPVTPPIACHPDRPNAPLQEKTSRKASKSFFVMPKWLLNAWHHTESLRKQTAKSPCDQHCASCLPFTETAKSV